MGERHMKINRKIAYTIEIILLLSLLICAFFISSNTRYVLSIIVLIFSIGIPFLVKKESIPYTSRYRVRTAMIVFAILYLALFYTLGIYAGFYESVIKFSFKNIFLYIIPITITIVGTEIIRNKLLVLNTKTSYLLVTLITVGIDVLLYVNIYNLKVLSDFLIVLGFLIFSSFSTNIFYNYMSPRYGKEPIIIYRLITTLFVYIIPVTPNVYIYFRTFIRIIYPFAMYLHIDSRYNPDREVERTVDKRKQNITAVALFIFLTLFIMLVSCKFTFGAIVVGSGSMQKEIDKGDVVVFKNSKKIKVGDVIVFEKNNMKIVHRVIKISSKDNENIYYTKGDANKTMDNGFVNEKKVLGKLLFKIKYLGKPTLWLREKFS